VVTRVVAGALVVVVTRVVAGALVVVVTRVVAGALVVVVTPESPEEHPAATRASTTNTISTFMPQP